MAAPAGFTEPPSNEEVAAMASLLESAELDGQPFAEGVLAEELDPVWVTPVLPAWSQWLDVTTDEAGVPVRHRVAFGGRGAAKSWTFAEKLLIRGTMRVERVLCTREYQRSIRDSVHRLLVDQINRLGLGLLGSGFYIVTDKEIRGRNGTLFIFQGLHRNEQGIKSLEGVTIAWVEEAQAVSQGSMDTLIPTIRQEGAEIWWSFNPKLPTDPVDKLFRGKEGPPPGTVLIPVNYYDNPWFPAVLHRDMEFDARRDPDKHAHIWLGAYLQRSEAKVFRNWRIMRFDVPEEAVLRFGADWGFSIDPTVLVQAFIGSWSDEPWNSDPVADPFGRVLFVAREAYEVGCPVDELPALFAGSDEGQKIGEERWKNEKGRPGVPGANRWKIVADSARPELIAYMKARGFNIEPAVKGPGSLEEGVTFLQSFDICVHPDCVHVADELTHYSYEVDKLTQAVLPKLADRDNHTIDALRYALEAVRRAGTGKMAFASTGARATLAAHGAEELEREMEKAQAIPARPGSSPIERGGGAGWGSAPSARTGL